MADMLNEPRHPELDAIEEKEWLESLDYVIKHGGPDRVQALLRMLQRRAAEFGINLPYSANTPYINSIARQDQSRFPGQRAVEREEVDAHHQVHAATGPSPRIGRRHHRGVQSVVRAVDVEDLTKHKMDSENFMVSQEIADLVNKANEEKRRVCAVGTTTMRALESAVSASGKLKAAQGWTDKFIFPEYDFKICNAMITNFQLPESTLLMMAAAFGGYDLIMEAYKVAMKEKYRFFSYGDALLII